MFASSWHTLLKGWDNKDENVCVEQQQTCSKQQWCHQIIWGLNSLLIQVHAEQIASLRQNKKDRQHLHPADTWQRNQQESTGSGGAGLAFDPSCWSASGS